MGTGSVQAVLEELWGPIAALTASHEGRANGLITSTAVTASLLPEAPRVTVTLARSSLTHDLVHASGAFALHLLAAEPPEPSLDCSAASTVAVDCLQMEPNEDSWESVRPPDDPELLQREELLQLARHLAEQRERHRDEELAEIEELKRTLRERAALVAAHEAELEQRRLELEQRDAATRSARWRRLRPPRAEAAAPAAEREPEQDAYADELLTRREAELEQRLSELLPKEQRLAEDEAKLRERELTVTTAENDIAVRAEALESERNDLEQAKRRLEEERAELERRNAELETSLAELTGRGDAAAATEAKIDRRRTELEAVALRLARRREEADAASADLARRAAELTALAATVAASGEESDSARVGLEELRVTLDRRERDIREREEQLAARSREQTAADDGAAAGRERRLDDRERQLQGLEQELVAREAELARLQAALAARQEELRRRELSLEDAERLRERAALQPVERHVSFSEGLDALSGGGRGRRSW